MRQAVSCRAKFRECGLLMQADEATITKLARLTAREKECLRRCLLPQTAKEMAIDLDVSPHAVEKRLKMARAKLGVSSSLAAARMLAEVEGYQRLVPQNSDLPTQLRHDHGYGIAMAVKRASRPYFLGGLGMIAIAMLIAFVAQDTNSSSASTTPPMLEKGRPVASRKVGWDEAQGFLKAQFKKKDADGSGYLDPKEASALEPRDSAREKALPPAPPSGQRDPSAERKWMAKLDTNHDGMVSEQEYVGYMLPWTLASGVPAE
ncbi:hypothetical protein EAH79_12400 [Sphingomonas koreensis]|nr:hypothetical protein EAH79_12400 [Sphingomonas koreensis]